MTVRTKDSKLMMMMMMTIIMTIIMTTFEGVPIKFMQVISILTRETITEVYNLSETISPFFGVLQFTLQHVFPSFNFF